MLLKLVLKVFSILRGRMTHYQNIFTAHMKENFFPNILIPIWVLKKVYTVWYFKSQVMYNLCVGVGLRRCFDET